MQCLLKGKTHSGTTYGSTGSAYGKTTDAGRCQISSENNQLTGLGFDANNAVISFSGKGIHPLFEHKKLNTDLRTVIENLGYGQKSVEETAKDIIEITNNFLEEYN